MLLIGQLTLPMAIFKFAKSNKFPESQRVKDDHDLVWVNDIGIFHGDGE